MFFPQPARAPCSWANRESPPMRQVGVRAHRLGQAEVGDLGRAVGREQNVGRLQIAMDDSLAVRLGDGPRQRFDQRGRPFGRPGRAVQLLRQASPLEVFELEVGPAVVVAEAIDLDDVGMRSFATVSASERKRTEAS